MFDYSENGRSLMLDFSGYSGDPAQCEIVQAEAVDNQLAGADPVTFTRVKLAILPGLLDAKALSGPDTSDWSHAAAGGASIDCSDDMSRKTALDCCCLTLLETLSTRASNLS